MKRVAMLALTLGLLSTGVYAQERNTGFMVHQLCVATNEGVATMNELTAVTAPILEDLRNEGMIMAWFDLRHGWGDEWNLGTVTVAESHRAWLDFWQEFLGRVREAEPGLIGRMNTSCELHKDNMYAIRDMGMGT